MNRCKSVTDKGVQCTRKPFLGGRYCWQHESTLVKWVKSISLGSLFVIITATIGLIVNLYDLRGIVYPPARQPSSAQTPSASPTTGATRSSTLTPTLTLTSTNMQTPTETPTPTPTLTHTPAPSMVRASSLAPSPTRTLTTTPTETPRQSSATPTHSLVPRLVAPPYGVYRGPTFTFSWGGTSSVSYQVKLINTDYGYTYLSNWIQGFNWTINVPAKEYGYWEWYVTSSDGAKSDTWNFVYDPFPKPADRPIPTRTPPPP